MCIDYALTQSFQGISEHGAVHRVVVHCIALHCIALHRIALHCIALPALLAGEDVNDSQH